MTTHPTLEGIIEGYAEAGGSTEIDNLRMALRQAASLMSAQQRLAFLSSDATMDTLEAALFEVDMDPPRDVEALIAAAIQHGEDSEPDMEPGDLQVYLRGAYEVLDADQRATFEASAPVTTRAPVR